MLKKSFISSVALATIFSVSAPAFAGGVGDMGPRPHHPQHHEDHGVMANTPTQAIHTAESSFPWIPLALFAIGTTAALVAGLSGHSHSSNNAEVVVLPN